MTKYAAFGTVLNMGAGDVQVETATVIGTITPAGAGNAIVIVTAANMTGSPITLDVPVANNDTASLVGGKIRDFINSNATAAAIRALFYITGSGANVILTRKIPMENDATLNVRIDDGTCDGLTNAPTSTNTNAGETLAAVAYISNIGGPSLSADTEDVTTHDSPGAWEEVVATILRTGELSLDIVYDPVEGTHDASTGLISLVDSRLAAGFEVVFPDTTTWAFAAFVNGFEPSAPVDGALTAAVKMKITGAPILA
jgi:predicted secreted protein